MSYLTKALSTGFPKPNMTIVKTTQTKNGPLVEDLSSDIYDIVGQWFFENFAVEVYILKNMYFFVLWVVVFPHEWCIS